MTVLRYVRTSLVMCSLYLPWSAYALTASTVALFNAIRHDLGLATVQQYLDQEDIEINGDDPSFMHETPLFAAIYRLSKDHAAIVALLIHHGALIDARNSLKQTPLIAAAMHGNLNAIVLLIKAGAALDMQDAQGWTALMYATFYGYLDIVKVLIAHGADSTRKNKQGNDILAIAQTMHLETGKKRQKEVYEYLKKMYMAV